MAKPTSVMLAKMPFKLRQEEAGADLDLMRFMKFPGMSIIKPPTDPIILDDKNKINAFFDENKRAINTLIGYIGNDAKVQRMIADSYKTPTNYIVSADGIEQHNLFYRTLTDRLNVAIFKTTATVEQEEEHVFEDDDEVPIQDDEEAEESEEVEEGEVEEGEAEEGEEAEESEEMEEVEEAQDDEEEYEEVARAQGEDDDYEFDEDEDETPKPKRSAKAELARPRKEAVRAGANMPAATLGTAAATSKAKARRPTTKVVPVRVLDAVAPRHDKESEFSHNLKRYSDASRPGLTDIFVELKDSGSKIRISYVALARQGVLKLDMNDE